MQVVQHVVHRRQCAVARRVPVPAAEDRAGPEDRLPDFRLANAVEGFGWGRQLRRAPATWRLRRAAPPARPQLPCLWAPAPAAAGTPSRRWAAGPQGVLTAASGGVWLGTRGGPARFRPLGARQNAFLPVAG